MDDDFDLCANRYGFYAVPRSFCDRVVPKVLASGEVYEPNTLAFIRRMAGNGDVISGGAFVGDFLPAISEVLAEGAELHSFEPNPVSLGAAQQTIALNRLRNVALHPVAVGAKPGTLFLRTIMADGSIAAARAKIVDRAKGDATVEVEVKRLDDLVGPGRKVSVLQLDLEGHETEALRGAGRILSSSRPFVVLELAKRAAKDIHLPVLQSLAPEARYVRAGWMERNAIYVSRA